jgi:hypothetical protein
MHPVIATRARRVGVGFHVVTHIWGSGILECHVDTNLYEGVSGNILYGKFLKVNIVLESFIGNSICQGVCLASDM